MNASALVGVPYLLRHLREEGDKPLGTPNLQKGVQEAQYHGDAGE
jgi:hypothetical protein